MRSNAWSIVEDQILETLYMDWRTAPEDLERALPRRTLNAIRLRASRTGIKRSHVDQVPEPEELELLPQWVREALA